MEKTSAGLIILGLAFGMLILSPFQEPQVLGSEITPEQVLQAPQPIHTTSRFETKLFTTTEKIDRPVSFKDDPESELGEEKVLAEGSDGKKTKVIKVTYYEGQEYDRELVSTEVVDPKEKIISRGTKIVWRVADFSGEQIRYWRKLRVWATHYDSHCPGCDETTAIGLRAGKGVIAVDPSGIKLRSKVFIPGYGQAIAGDTGGSIKGIIIDLGFEDAHTAGWSAHFVDIYLE